MKFLEKTNNYYIRFCIFVTISRNNVYLPFLFESITMHIKLKKGMLCFSVIYVRTIIVKANGQKNDSLSNPDDDIFQITIAKF